MGNCYRSNRENEEITVVFDDCFILKEKITKAYKLNPLHNYGTKRQILLEQDYLSMKQSKSSAVVLDEFFSQRSDIFSPSEAKIIKFTLKMLEDLLKVFSNPDMLFLNVMMFVLCNTKNNFEKKQEVILDVINDCFFTNNSDKQVDLSKIKKFIKSLLRITITIFENMVMALAFITKEKFVKLLEWEMEGLNTQNQTNFETKEESSQCGVVSNIFSIFEIKINDIIFSRINSQLKKDCSPKSFLEKWEDFLLTPVIFAGYSNAKNIDNYNLQLREEIIKRLAILFDADKIINSFVNQTIE